MTLLNFLQTHSLEEILENDKAVEKITYGLNNYWNPYLSIGWDNYDINVCIKNNCRYFIEDTDIYDFFGHNCKLLEDKEGEINCPYKDEHKKSKIKDAKQILSKDLES